MTTKQVVLVWVAAAAVTMWRQAVRSALAVAPTVALSALFSAAVTKHCHYHGTLWLD